MWDMHRYMYLTYAYIFLSHESKIIIIKKAEFIVRRFGPTEVYITSFFT